MSSFIRIYDSSFEFILFAEFFFEALFYVHVDHMRLVICVNYFIFSAQITSFDVLSHIWSCCNWVGVFWASTVSVINFFQLDAIGRLVHIFHLEFIEELLHFSWRYVLVVVFPYHDVNWFVKWFCMLHYVFKHLFSAMLSWFYFS